MVGIKIRCLTTRRIPNRWSPVQDLSLRYSCSQNRCHTRLGEREINLVPSERFELPTFCFEDRHSSPTELRRHLARHRGLEPLTPCMPCKCATSCATGPQGADSSGDFYSLTDSLRLILHRKSARVANLSYVLPKSNRVELKRESTMPHLIIHRSNPK